MKFFGEIQSALFTENQRINWNNIGVCLILLTIQISLLMYEYLNFKRSLFYKFLKYCGIHFSLTLDRTLLKTSISRPWGFRRNIMLFFCYHALQLAVIYIFMFICFAANLCFAAPLVCGCATSGGCTAQSDTLIDHIYSLVQTTLHK